METTADTDAGSTAAQDFPRFPLDMDAIARAALADKLRRWRIEFNCDSSVWLWTGEAGTEARAIQLAREQLAAENSFFHPGRATVYSCVEVSA